MNNEKHQSSHLHSDTPNEILKAERDVDEARRELEFALSQLDSKIGEAVSNVESKVQNVTSSVESRVRDFTQTASGAVNSFQTRVSSLQTRVETTFTGMDQTVDRFGNQVRGWVGIADEFSGKIDSFLNQIRSDFSRYMSRAEELANRLHDPAEYLSRNPRLAGPALLIAGLVVGILFRDSLRTKQSASLTDSSMRDGGIGTNVRKIA